MKTFKPLAIAVLLNLAASPVALADGHLSKSQVKEQAVELCHSEAEKRYGVGSIVYSGR